MIIKFISLIPPIQKPSGDKTSQNQSFPPRGSSASSTQGQPAQHQQYNNKPPPPLPGQDNLRSHSYGGSSQGRQHSPAVQPQDIRSHSYGGVSGQGRQPSPTMGPQGGHAYTNSPPSNNGRFPPQYQTQPRPPQGTRPPPSPAPGGKSADPTLLPLFRAVDKTGTPFL